MTRAMAMLVAAGLLAGCAHTRQKPLPSRGSSIDRAADGAGVTHYPLAMGHIAMGATPEAQEPPVYPPALLASCPATVELHVQVVVDRQGRVDDVRMPWAPAHSSFAAAVRRAVAHWRYTPLTITRWAADADGNSHTVDSETRPFSLDYVFTFRCEHGHPSVSVSAGDSSR